MFILPLIFYQKFGKYHKAIGFEVNIYNPFVTSNMVHNKQIKITCHVDDLKVAHSYKDIFDAFVECNKDTYKYVPKINPSRGKIHAYPATDLD